jgi:DHHC palmitoyltransferase
MERVTVSAILLEAMIVVTDPYSAHLCGYLSQDEEAGHGGWFWNEQVGSYRPPGALYCRECGVLIQDYDHLCPWTGTGIGRDK